MMNYNHLYYFHMIAAEGSLKKAAERLGISQSTLSEQLKSLETYFNTRLFDRRSSGLRLNDRGRQVLRFTTVIFGAGGRLVQMFHKDEENPKQTLEIGLCASISRTLAVDLFLPILQRDDVHVRIRQGSFDELVAKLASHELDIFVSDGQPNTKNFKGIRTVEIQQPKHFLVYSEEMNEDLSARIKEGAKIKFITYTPESTLRWEIDHYLQHHQINIEIVGEVDDTSIMRVAAEKGLGAAILAEQVVRESMAERKLLTLSELPPLYTKIYANFNETETLDLVKETVQLLTSKNGNGAVEIPSQETTEGEETPSYA